MSRNTLTIRGFLALLAIVFVIYSSDAFERRPADNSSPQQSTYVTPIRMINGLETMRVDKWRVAVYRGSAADNTAKSLIQVEDTLTLDIRKIGPGGRDVSGSPSKADRTIAASEDGAGSDQKPLRGWYMPVLIDDPNDQDPPSAVLSQTVSSMRINTSKHVSVDPRFVLRRNLPSAFFFDPKSGFRPMICYGHPQPFCLWSHQGLDADELSIFSGELKKGSVRLDASDFVPPTGRILRMALNIENHGASTAIVSLKPTATIGLAAPVAAVPPQGMVIVAEASTATSSTRQFVIETTEPVSVHLHALGFSILQPH